MTNWYGFTSLLLFLLLPALQRRSVQQRPGRFQQAKLQSLGEN